MSFVAQLGLSESAFTTPIPSRTLAEAAADFDLIACIRAFDGWVAPDGLAPRAVLDRLVEQGRLEAWPGRPLYRAPRSAATASGGVAV
jgi:hypothetical protein